MPSSIAQLARYVRHLTAVRLMSRMRAPSRVVSAVPNCCTAASSVSRRSVFSAAATAFCKRLGLLGMFEVISQAVTCITSVLRYIIFDMGLRNRTNADTQQDNGLIVTGVGVHTRRSACVGLRGVEIDWVLLILRSCCHHPCSLLEPALLHPAGCIRRM